ncbi:MAG: hypothetical protein N838_00415 [Thiohalocapsa sp. PB-PSB1]|nr:MAG: hypothetical protein N838_00415 [Thiohalocapsa sp. PB-PSB1]
MELFLIALIVMLMSLTKLQIMNMWMGMREYKIRVDCLKVTFILSLRMLIRMVPVQLLTMITG